MKPVALGVIGCGVIGRHHLRAASRTETVRVVAVADLLEDRVREAAAQYDIPRHHRSGAALLDDPAVEAVILALPACGRFELAMEAFRNGLHVLDEKPVAMDARQVGEMIAARGNLVAVCGSSRVRYSETARRVRELIASGALGELRVLTCRAIVAPSEPPKTPPPTWRLIRAENGGGILMNWGCYDLDYLLGLTGWTLEPQTVLARTWTVPPTYRSYVAPGSDAETHIAALILCANGAAITYERSEFTAAQPESLWRITGDRGSLHLHLTAGKEFTVRFSQATADRGTVTQDLFPPAEEPKDGMQMQLEDFARAIREGGRPQTGLQEALVVQRISDAVYASAASGTAVRV